MEQPEYELRLKRYKWINTITTAIVVLLWAVLMVYLIQNIEWAKMANNPCQMCESKTNSTCIKSFTGTAVNANQSHPTIEQLYNYSLNEYMAKNQPQTK